jgi:predicted alpha/beta-hydrolase family hydrolase
VTITQSASTPVGLAEVALDRPKGRARAILALGHGAAGGVNAVDLVAVRDAAVGLGFVVARVTQPYRVAGRRAPAPATALDAAFTAVVEQVRADVGPRLPLVVGGRSSGARVACRTARGLGAVGVLALAFPLHPPGRPDRSRANELDPDVRTLVINGEADPFGVPEPTGRVKVAICPGERHDLRRDPLHVATIAAEWLRDLPGITSLKMTNPA